MRLFDLVFAVSEALDLVSPAIAGHHRRVAAVADAVAAQIGLPEADRRDLVLAAALHDGGALTLRGRLDTLEFEMAHPHEHARAGERLLRCFPGFSRAAVLVRYHHLPWDGGRGERDGGEAVPLGSHVLHLADRLSVLLAGRGEPAVEGRRALAKVVAGAGERFVPELVRALEEAAAAPGFWEEAAAPRLAGVAVALGADRLSGADLRGLARLLWQLVDFRSRYTATHTSGVAAVAGRLADCAGVGGEAAGRIELAAGLHDLGKLAVPAEVLEQERALSPGDRALVQRHPLDGYRVLRRVPGLEEVNVFASYHHERLDGTGYPFRLAGDAIPLGSRIVAVADVFTALTEERPYRRGMSGRETVAVLRDMAAGGALDSAVVDLAADRREELDGLRRLAQERAGERYLAFREHRAGPAACASRPAA